MILPRDPELRELYLTTELQLAVEAFKQTTEGRYLHARRGIGLLIEGSQTGANRHPQHWANSRGVPFITEVTHWQWLGNQAG